MVFLLQYIINANDYNNYNNKNKRETQKCNQKCTEQHGGARAPRVGCTFLVTWLSFALIFYYNYCNNYNL